MPKPLTVCEKNDVVPTSSQNEALARYSIPREVTCSVLKWETVKFLLIYKFKLL